LRSMTKGRRRGGARGDKGESFHALVATGFEPDVDGGESTSTSIRATGVGIAQLNLISTCSVFIQSRKHIADHQNHHAASTQDHPIHIRYPCGRICPIGSHHGGEPERIIDRECRSCHRSQVQPACRHSIVAVDRTCATSWQGMGKRYWYFHDSPENRS
jgi:hypothetical protein